MALPALRIDDGEPLAAAYSQKLPAATKPTALLFLAVLLNLASCVSVASATCFAHYLLAHALVCAKLNELLLSQPLTMEDGICICARKKWVMCHHSICIMRGLLLLVRSAPVIE